MSILKPNISDAIVALGVDGGFKVVNGKIAKWYSEKKQPTEGAIQDKLKELENEYEKQAYARSRADAYPSWQTQLDQLFHQGYDGWKAEVQKVKDQFPKP